MHAGGGFESRLLAKARVMIIAQARDGEKIMAVVLRARESSDQGRRLARKFAVERAGMIFGRGVFKIHGGAKGRLKAAAGFPGVHIFQPVKFAVIAAL